MSRDQDGEKSLMSFTKPFSSLFTQPSDFQREASEATTRLSGVKRLMKDFRACLMVINDYLEEEKREEEVLEPNSSFPSHQRALQLLLQLTAPFIRRDQSTRSKLAQGLKLIAEVGRTGLTSRMYLDAVIDRLPELERAETGNEGEGKEEAAKENAQEGERGNEGGYQEGAP
jgi:hypothetical protein